MPLMIIVKFEVALRYNKREDAEPTILTIRGHWVRFTLAPQNKLEIFVLLMQVKYC